MRALTWQGNEHVEVTDVADPKIEEPTDIVIRVTSTAICGSDLHLYGVLGPFLKPGDPLRPESMGIGWEAGPGGTLLRALREVPARALRPVRDHAGTRPGQGGGPVRVHLAVRVGAGRPGAVPAGAAGPVRAGQDPRRRPGRAVPVPVGHPADRLPGRGLRGRPRRRHAGRARPGTRRADV